MIRAARNRSRVVFIAIAASLIAACANERGPHPNLPPLGARVEFRSTNLCSLGVSPEIRLGGVPGSTSSYRLRLVNISVLRAPIWERTQAANGPLILEGAISDFEAPCPGDLQNFTYRLEVMALASSGQPLAYGWTFASAQSITRQIEREQYEAKNFSKERANRDTFPPAVTPPLFVQ
jgi:hypothetical protein